MGPYSFWSVVSWYSASRWSVRPRPSKTRILYLVFGSALATSSDDDRHFTKWGRVDEPFSPTGSPIELTATDQHDLPAPGTLSLTPLLVLTSAPALPAPAPAIAATEPSAPAPVASTAATQTPVETQAGPRPLRQLALSPFYAPQSLGDAQAQLDQEIAIRQSQPSSHWVLQFPSPALDSLLENLRSPRTVIAWLEALHARKLTTPGNGACNYYSFYGCRTRVLRGKITMTVCTLHNTECNHYKRGICRAFLDYLEHMISDGTVTIADLTRRYYGQGPPSDSNRPAAIRAIKRFIQAILSADVKNGLTRAQWGGDEELFAAVWYIREPIFIITEAADASTSVRVIWLDRPTLGGQERIIQLFPDAGEAYEMLPSFLRHRVLPTMLMHGSTSGDGHFNCLRFDEQLFAQWTTGDADGSAMRGRMDQVLVTLGWYVAPRDTTDIPSPQTVLRYESASGSTYDPSFILTDASPPNSPHPLTPTAHFALLSALNPRRRSRDILAPLWAQAESLNLVAYRTWSEAASERTAIRR